MLFSGLVAILATSLLAEAANMPSRNTICGTDEQPSAALLDLVKDLGSPDSENASHPSQDLIRNGNIISVDVYAHVISSDKTRQQGYLPINSVRNQIDVLNAGFKQAGFDFTLRDVNWVVNKTLSSYSNQEEARRTLHKGRYTDLNLFIMPHTFLGEYVLLGEATFPDMSAAKPDGPEDRNRAALDGIVLHSFATPGNPQTYGKGVTLIHEVGHWLGLLHTFQGGCSASGGDHISDTPPQAVRNFGCPVGRDSCPDPGLDPIHNYMDYTDDDCRTEFTPLQIQAMRGIWSLVRSLGSD